MPIRCSGVIRVQCWRWKLSEVHTIEESQGEFGRQLDNGRVPPVGICKRCCAAGTTETPPCGDETLLFRGLTYGDIGIYRDLHYPVVHAAVGWLVGSRKRKNDFLKDLQASIDLLSSENRKLLADITAVNSEIVAVRKENEELKASVDRLCTENSQLKVEVRQLREQVAKARR